MEELFLEERSSIERLRWLEQADEEAVPPPWGHGGCDRYDHARLITIQISFQWEGDFSDSSSGSGSGACWRKTPPLVADDSDSPLMRQHSHVGPGQIWEPLQRCKIEPLNIGLDAPDALLLVIRNLSGGIH